MKKIKQLVIYIVVIGMITFAVMSGLYLLATGKDIAYVAPALPAIIEKDPIDQYFDTQLNKYTIEAQNQERIMRETIAREVAYVEATPEYHKMLIARKEASEDLQTRFELMQNIGIYEAYKDATDKMGVSTLSDIDNTDLINSSK